MCAAGCVDCKLSFAAQTNGAQSVQLKASRQPGGKPGLNVWNGRRVLLKAGRQPVEMWQKTCRKAHHN